MVLDTMTLEELIREIKTEKDDGRTTYGNSGKQLKKGQCSRGCGKRISRHEDSTNGTFLFMQSRKKRLVF